MTSALWFGSYDTFRDVNGKAYVGAIATFYVGGTTSPLIVYQDNGLATPWGSSVTAAADGIFPGVFLPEGEYSFRVTTATGVQISAGGPIEAVPTITVSSGGGTVDPTTIFQTGDAIFLEYAGTRTGWVRDNGRTIGNALSGATERANADCVNLYAWYWNNFADSICPVSGGRGGSASADFAAGKPIQVLDKRGRMALGLDDMGNSAANRVQASTTVTTTAASTACTVASTTGLAIGMYIVSANIPAGTFVTSIVGSTVNMSAAATVSASGTAARFSYVLDAQVAGQTGGQSQVTLTVDGIPSHSHTGTTTSNGAHTHTAGFQSGGSSDAGFAGAIATGSTTTSSNGAHTHTFTSDTTGNGRGHNNIPPVILGTWLRKLVAAGSIPVVAELAMKFMANGANGFGGFV